MVPPVDCKPEGVYHRAKCVKAVEDDGNVGYVTIALYSSSVYELASEKESLWISVPSSITYFMFRSMLLPLPLF